MAKTSGIEDLIRDSDYGSTDHYEPGVAGRKRGPVVKPKPQHGSQAWRKLEDRLNERRLRRKLKEIYEDE